MGSVSEFMTKKKTTKVKKKIPKKIKPKNKKTGLLKGNEFTIPKYIEPKESWFRKILKCFGF